MRHRIEANLPPVVVVISILTGLVFPGEGRGQCTEEAEALLHEMKLAVEANDWRGFDQFTSDLVLGFPECQEGFWWRANFLFLTRRFSWAEEMATRALELDPSDIQSLKVRISARFAQRDWLGLLSDSDSFLGLTDDPSEQYQVRGFRAGAFQELEDYDSMLVEGETMVRLAPSKSNGYNVLAIARGSRGEWELAVEAGLRGLDLCESDRERANLLHGLGRARTVLKDYALARENLDESIELNASLSRAYLDRAKLSMEEGKLDEARADLRMAIEHASSDEEREDAETLLQEIGL